MPEIVVILVKLGIGFSFIVVVCLRGWRDEKNIELHANDGYELFIIQKVYLASKWIN